MRYSALAETIRSIHIIQEADSLPTIYCDMDGVLTDFNQAIENMFKIPDTRTDINPMRAAGYDNAKEWLKAPMSSQKWEPVTNYGMFWPAMPWTKDGKLVWNYIKKFKPHILSAYTPFDKNSRKGKMLWIKRNLGISASNVHLVRRSEKKVYAKGNVLIDDYGRNIKEWKKNKGIPVKHKSASETISQLRKIGYV